MLRVCIKGFLLIIKNKWVIIFLTDLVFKLSFCPYFLISVKRLKIKIKNFKN